MNQISLIATDLDGTLLNSQGQISMANRRAIQEAKAKGVHIVLATTRNRDFVQSVAEELGLQDPIICANGAEVFASATGECWAAHTIPQAVARQIVELADANHWALLMSINSSKYFLKYPDQVPGPIGNNQYVVARNIDGLVGNPSRILTRNPHAAECLARLCQSEFSIHCHTERYETEQGAFHSFGIFPAKGDKATALALVLARLNLQPGNVMALGDNYNDLALFTHARIRVAMANGVPALKNHATVIAPSNDDDGVAWAIRRYCL